LQKNIVAAGKEKDMEAHSCFTAALVPLQHLAAFFTGLGPVSC